MQRSGGDLSGVQSKCYALGYLDVFHNPLEPDDFGPNPLELTVGPLSQKLATEVGLLGYRSHLPQALVTEQDPALVVARKRIRKFVDLLICAYQVVDVPETRPC